MSLSTVFESWSLPTLFTSDSIGVRIVSILSRLLGLVFILPLAIFILYDIVLWVWRIWHRPTLQGPADETLEQDASTTTNTNIETNATRSTRRRRG